MDKSIEPGLPDRMRSLAQQLTEHIARLNATISKTEQALQAFNQGKTIVEVKVHSLDTFALVYTLNKTDGQLFELVKQEIELLHSTASKSRLHYQKVSEIIGRLEGTGIDE